VKALSPATEVWGAEPAGFDETRRSLASGQRETIDKDARSICDALLTPIPGELTWPINSRNLSGSRRSPTPRWPRRCATPSRC
jgi:threonine dehydratase